MKRTILCWPRTSLPRRTLPRPALIGVALLPAVLGAAGLSALAQTAPSTLPSAPSAVTAAASITGLVTDADGALVRDATLTVLANGRTLTTTLTDSSGRYLLRGLPAGTVTVLAAATGLATRPVAFTLTAGEQLDAPPIALAAAAAVTVNVSALTPTEVATQEVHLEEHQRVLGIIPNFNVTYSQHPVPLNVKQKIALTSHQLFDPTTFLFAGIGAGILQADNTWPGYHQGAAGYGKRFGALLAGSAGDSLLTHGLFPIVFRQDPRYYFKTDGTAWQRTRYALETSVIRRGDNGRWQPNYMTLAGGLANGAIAQLYLPPGSRAASSTVIEGAAIGLISSGFSHVLQQFVFNHITTESRQNAAKP